MAEPTPIAVPPALQGLDPEAVALLRDARVSLERLSGLDERSIELVRFGALIALAAPAESIRAHVERARAIGMSDEEVWGAVLAVATLVGVPRLIAAVPVIREALSGIARS
jgi:alkylhydroperoxidase/carboxymuconolactone decarboxylase family protein YurZ